MKEKMLEVLNASCLPLYFDEKRVIREFIETFFNKFPSEKSLPKELSYMELSHEFWNKNVSAADIPNFGEEKTVAILERFAQWLDTRKGYE